MHKMGLYLRCTKRPFVLVLENGLRGKSDFTINGLIFGQIRPLSPGSKASAKLMFSSYVVVLILFRKH